VTLGPDLLAGQHYFHVIRRRQWFVRRLESPDPQAFTLIGCTVVPAYHPDDIETATLAEIQRGERL